MRLLLIFTFSVEYGVIGSLYIEYIRSVLIVNTIKSVSCLNNLGDDFCTIPYNFSNVTSAV